MTTTERIVEIINNRFGNSLRKHDVEHLKTSILMVIEQDGRIVERKTLSKAIDFGAELEAGVIQMDWKKYKTYVDMFLDIPKT